MRTFSSSSIPSSLFLARRIAPSVVLMATSKSASSLNPMALSCSVHSAFLRDDLASFNAVYCSRSCSLWMSYYVAWIIEPCSWLTEAFPHIKQIGKHERYPFTFSSLALAACSCNLRPCSFRLAASLACSSSVFSSTTGATNGNWITLSFVLNTSGSS